MIAFITLLLGLVSGVFPIEVSVSGPVARVEFLVDGKVAAATSTPPWKSYVDLGAGLAPRELVARALDAEGVEIGRAVQWINLPRPPAEVEIVLENGAGGKPRRAHLTWQSVNNVAPGSIGLTFDGRPLVLDADRRATLPEYRPTDLHILSAEVWFGPGVVGRKDIAFGGEYGSEVSTELTAIPIRLRGKGATLAPSALRGRFAREGQTLNVAAIEEGPGKVIVVDVPGPRRIQDRFFWSPGGLRLGRDKTTIEAVPQSTAGLEKEMRFDPDIVVRLMSPLSQHYAGSGVAAELFDLSRDFGSKDGGLLSLLLRSGFGGGARDARRIADAVAVAGLQAAVEGRRRAVILLLSDEADDASRYTAEAARRYLAAIRVPLYVWSLYGPKAPSAAIWGPAEDISSLKKLYRAFDKVKDDLDSQRIVWIEGRFLPQAVSLVPGTSSIEQLDPGALPPSPRGSR
jgi:hypothetical protein